MQESFVTGDRLSSMHLLVITHVPYRGFIAEVYVFQTWVKKEFAQKFYSVKTLHETPTNRFNENIGKHVLLLFHSSVPIGFLMFSGDTERNQLYKMANAEVKYKLSLLISVTHHSEEKK